MRLSLVSTLATATCLGLASAQVPTVTVDNGVFVGVQTTVPSGPVAVKKYLGMPFAVTPPQRFAPPVKPPNSNTVKQATQFGPNCIGTGPFPPSVLAPGAPADSEDCLYINVFAPATAAPSGGRSVLLWFYGGGFVSGGSSIVTYDGANMASFQDVIVVSFNYRLNVFGFPGPIPGLASDKQNPGLLDQRLALDWVRRNIAKFGGNPNKITLFGESAGAASVDFLYLTTSSTSPPFRGVIMESGSYYINDNGIGLLAPQVPTPAEPIITFSNAIGCGYGSGTLACLRGKTTAQLKTALDQTNVQWQATPDGVTVPLDNKGWRIRKSGGGAKVPTLLGTNKDEGTVFILFGTPGTFRYFFDLAFPELKPYEAQIRAKYPIGGCSPQGCWATEADAVAAVATDYIFTCTASREALAGAACGVPTWRYHFNRTTATTPPPLSGKVLHSDEIPYVFGTIQSTATADEISVSKYMQKAWADFAKNPTLGPGSGWKKYTGAAGVKEVAMLGGPANPSGRADIDDDVIDNGCSLYAPVYTARDGW